MINIILQLAVYTTSISLIYCQLGGYHLPPIKGTTKWPVASPSLGLVPRLWDPKLKTEVVFPSVTATTPLVCLEILSEKSGPKLCYRCGNPKHIQRHLPQMCDLSWWWLLKLEWHKVYKLPKSNIQFALEKMVGWKTNFFSFWGKMPTFMAKLAISSRDCRTQKQTSEMGVNHYQP